jgi:Redoxin.
MDGIHLKAINKHEIILFRFIPVFRKQLFRILSVGINSSSTRIFRQRLYRKTGSNCTRFHYDAYRRAYGEFVVVARKVVMLQFTASWCGVCRKEMPFIERDIWQRWKSNPSFALYAIDRDEPLDVAKNFILSTGITYPMALDPGATHFQLYADKEAGVTRNIIIDKEGKIVFMTRLYNETEFKAMVAKLEELLK